MTEKELHLVVIDRVGEKHVLPALEGWRVMEVIRDHGLPIRAECGGSCACATCHVYIDAAWHEKLVPPRADEEEMMDALAAFKPKESRLSCQILMRSAYDGLTVTLAPEEEV